MEKQRRFKRHHVEIMNIKGRMAVSRGVEILEIGRKGMTLLADMRLNVGGEYVLRLRDREGPFEVRGTVESSSIRETVQTAEGDFIPIYRAEMIFVNVPAEGIARLDGFIGHLHMLEEDKLKDLVFSISHSESARIDLPAGYRVKKISLGGMLIESVQPLIPEHRVPMELSLPDYRAIHLVGRVASCLAIPDSEAFDVGIEFIEMPEKAKADLRAFIDILEQPREHVKEKDLWKQNKDL